ncbi:MAG: tRNA (adenosine(37)-N6)-threonylcarbamoyltransferase complex ATPase subunit type 1 TsaE, partial [Lachnospiraceae bacterium]|nr:tRNA (adenosine(37)-N6)-threonylcarbamoyltransferase complex ATPase subunit type 1 TsaE [Lachnospiraceae bacterium]
MKEYRSKSAAETAAIAEEIGRNAAAGTVLALKGDLGAGKTVFAQG